VHTCAAFCQEFCHAGIRGGGLHHICLAVDDIEATMNELKNKGVRLINDAPLTSTDGRRYAFIHPQSATGVLVELYEQKN